MNQPQRLSSTGDLRGDRTTPGMDPAPVQSLQKSGRLCRRQPHHAVLDGGPLEAALLKPLVTQVGVQVIR